MKLKSNCNDFIENLFAKLIWPVT